MKCPHCRNKAFPAGPRWLGVQRWRCVSCTRQFTTEHGVLIPKPAQPAQP